MCLRWQHKSRAHGGDPGSLAHSIKARVDVLRFLGSRRDNSGIQWGYFEDHMGIIDLFWATWYRCEWGDIWAGEWLHIPPFVLKYSHFVLEGIPCIHLWDPL